MEEYKTKYGAIIPKELLIRYFEKITSKIFRCLPAIEEGSATLSIYIEFLLIELAGGNRLIYNDVLFLDLLANLESLTTLTSDFPRYRSQVLKCVNMCNLIINNIQRGADIDGV